MTMSHRYITSLFMTAVYLLIVFSPLTPLAMQSKMIAHAVTGECSGDCKIDGCSLERSANHTCCCWQKKQHLRDDTHRHDMAKTVVTPPGPPAKNTWKKSSCCNEPASDSHTSLDETSSVSATPAESSTGAIVTSSPCGTGKLFDLLNSEQAQHIPYFFVDGIPSPEQTPLTASPPGFLTSRYGDPPDLPPQVRFIS
ncbi:MAG: hypothetical protein PHI31_03460 [Desulfuromonadaceae bacterium]|nr:hypothetical protein [Desulfuromonadaceae bacterium]